MNLSTPRIIAIFKYALFELQKPKITKNKQNKTKQQRQQKNKQNEKIEKQN